MQNVLIKIAKVETNPFTGDRMFNPVMLPESDKFVYSEFLKIINEKNQLGLFLPGEEKITIGSSISELKIGDVFSIWSGMTSFRRTSTVEEIITPNLFRTRNSLYFIKDQKFFIQQNREEKLNQIIND
jgi:hypothetical protein